MKIWPDYTMACDSCGSTGCYADDTTYTCSGSDPAALSEKLTEKFKVVSDFLVSNKLKLNDDKTHLMVMTTSQARLAKNKRGVDIKVEITTPSKVIEASKSEKLLGCQLHQDMKWTEHLRDNGDSLIRSLNTRIGALKILGRVASFKVRRMIANGIFISKISYLIAVWGGCSQELLNQLQVAQNKAARVVTKLDWYTPTKVLLHQCGWLSVQQLVAYHSVVLVYKVLKTQKPQYLYSMFSSQYQYDTRQAKSGMIKHTERPRLEMSLSSFRYRAAKIFNELPPEIRNKQTIQNFKIAAKDWIRKTLD